MVIYTTGIDGILDFVSDLGIVGFALRGVLLEGEVYFVGIILLLVGFTSNDGVEVAHKWDCAHQTILGVDRDVLRLYLEEVAVSSSRNVHMFSVAYSL